MSERIRPLALCVIWRGDEVLVAEGVDPTTDRRFYRPLGGGIEFGERGDAAAIRELREELGAAVTDLRYLGTLENIFRYNGTRGHEIVRLYEARFADDAWYARDELTGGEDDGTPIRAVWKSIAFFDEGHAPLYPDGLLELLTKGADDDADPA